MKKYFFFVLFLIATITSNAQVKLEDFIKPGTKLIYSVENRGDVYDFVVTVKEKKGLSFTWQMTSPANISGKIIQTPSALQDGFKMWNYFDAGTKKLDDKTLSVWISQKVVHDLTQTTKPVKLCIYGPKDAPLDMKCLSDEVLKITIDGEQVVINEKVVRPVKKEGNKWARNYNIEDYFTFNNAASFPVILALQVDFKIVLREVKTK